MSNVYEIVTEKVLSAIEQGVAPWRKPWNSDLVTIGGERVSFPLNAKSGKTYRGINIALLLWEMQVKGYTDPRWVTYKQAQELGGSVRKDEKGTMVVFWKMIDASQVKPEDKDETEPQTKTASRKRIPLLRYYTVFNVEQCEGLKIADLERVAVNQDERNAAADAILAGKPFQIPVHNSDRAAYSPSMDILMMPRFGDFDSADSYYSTRFHEEVHATGHSSRLNRPGIVSYDGFGSETYSREELVAEMGAAFLCAHAGIDNTDQSAAYVKGWASFLKSDPKAVVVAAAQAQKAAEYILGAGAEETDTEE